MTKVQMANVPFKISGTITRGLYNPDVLQQTEQAYNQSWYHCLTLIYQNPQLKCLFLAPGTITHEITHESTHESTHEGDCGLEGMELYAPIFNQI